MTIRPDLIPGRYYTFDDMPERGIFMFTNDYSDGIKERSAPLRFVQGEIIRLYCGIDVKVTEVKDESIR